MRFWDDSVSLGRRYVVIGGRACKRKMMMAATGNGEQQNVGQSRPPRLLDPLLLHVIKSRACVHVTMVGAHGFLGMICKDLQEAETPMETSRHIQAGVGRYVRPTTHARCVVLGGQPYAAVIAQRQTAAWPDQHCPGRDLTDHTLRTL